MNSVLPHHVLYQILKIGQFGVFIFKERLPEDVVLQITSTTSSILQYMWGGFLFQNIPSPCNFFFFFLSVNTSQVMHNA